jgi:hypothetical protein
MWKVRCGMRLGAGCETPLINLARGSEPCINTPCNDRQIDLELKGVAAKALKAWLEILESKKPGTTVNFTYKFQMTPRARERRLKWRKHSSTTS